MVTSAPAPAVGLGGLRAGSDVPRPGTGGTAGLVASPRYPGWGWMVRQRKPTYLYAVRFPGADPPHVVRAIRVLGVVKLDWGDLVYQDGKLYIIESDQPWTRTAPGQMRVIYEIREPDPLGPSSVRPSARYRYAHPDGRRYKPKRRSATTATSSSSPRRPRRSCIGSLSRSPPSGSTDPASWPRWRGLRQCRWPPCRRTG